MYVEDEARMFSERTTAWPLACYEAFWTEASYGRIWVMLV